ncbi:MAG TPA: hypothetical protein DIT64_07910 [Verrucomicrobiales bacterium]|nr:hypothetical protein [Verrucomicrobiales bacterium]HCN78196.1 hypothetical protein [Verrucomicrobiales bacterium]HRJ09191.1 hypothetical protein [Prosthecobacter sp.]HRK15804.1 hypothetical protein [Prosthecobacter sp.]
MEPTSTAAAATGVGLASLAAFGVIFIINLVCWIKVLIALFKKEGAGLGILGILCSIYAYIWGWMKSTELGLKKTMVWWTIAILASIVLSFVSSAAMVGVMASNPEFQKAMQEAQEKAQQLQQEQPAPQQ